MTTAEMEALRDAWLEEWRQHYANTQEDWDAMDRVELLGMKDPEVCWQFIQGMVVRKLNFKFKSVLAAGPLETVLECHGPAFIDRAESWFYADPEFRELLLLIWCDPNIMDSATLERLRALGATVLNEN